MTGTLLHSRRRRITSSPSRSGRPEIDDDDVGLAGGDLDQPIGGGPRLEQPVALTGERGAQEASDLWLVLDEDDDGIRHGPAPGSARRAAA